MYYAASCGGSLYDPNPLVQEELAIILLEERNQVCYTWLVDRLGMRKEDACAALERFAEACSDEVVPTYLVEGYNRFQGHPITLITQNVPSVLNAFSETPQPQVFCYGLTPKTPYVTETETDSSHMITDEDEPTPPAHRRFRTFESRKRRAESPSTVPHKRQHTDGHLML